MRLIGALALAAATTLGIAVPAAAAGGDTAVVDLARPADVDDFTFASMHADYTLTRDADGFSSLHVQETFVAVFPDFDQNRGLMRAVPIWYQGVNTEPQIISVTDENGTPRPMEVSDDGEFVTIVSRADDYLHGRQTFVITYEQRNVTRFFEDVGDDEFYWDITGDEAAQPYDEVTATLHLDESLADAVTGNAACYTGSYGDDTPCDSISRTDPVTFALTQRNVPPYAGVTMAVGFTAGTFTQAEATEPSQNDGGPIGTTHRPDAAQQSAEVVTPLQWGLFGVALATLVGGGVLRRTALKDAPGHPTVVPQYEPPVGVDAFAAAVMLGKTDKALPAEVLEQAVRGSIQLIEGPRRTLTARLVDPSLAGDRDGHEVLVALFGPALAIGTEFAFGTYNSAFTAEVTNTINGVTAAQRAGGVWRKVSGWVRVPLIVVGTVTGLGGLLLGFLLAAATGNVLWAVLGFAAVVMAVIGATLVSKKPYSELGAGLRDHLDGLKLFMQWAEADRIRMLQSPEGAERVRIDASDPRQVLRIYEPLLPFAVVFGIEKAWSKQIVVYYEQVQQQPLWFSGPNGFSGAYLATALHSVGSSTTAPSSSSSSSSFGGSFGGGFSGGGGGGGRVGGV